MARLSAEIAPRSRPALRFIASLGFVVAITAVIASSGPQAISTGVGWLATSQDSLPWYAARLLGLFAYWALAGSVVYGLALSTGLLDRLSARVVSLSLHQELSAIAIGLTLVHGAVLLLDTFVRTTLVQLAVPFAAAYRPEWVGVGQLSLYLMVVVYGSFYVRRRIGQRAWRLLHYTTLLAFAGATAHGLMAGTDTASPFAFWSYVTFSALVVFLVGYRISMAVLRKESRA